jgi:adenylate kinase family enzyme
MQEPMTKRIHLVGASGSGTTTLGRALAEQLGCPHIDTDQHYWQPTNPPFREPHPVVERQALLGAELAQSERWVLSGSLCGWGDIFIPLFDLVVFLWVPPETRLARIRARERGRYGEAAIALGGELHDDHVKFMAWTAGYDDGDLTMRSRRLHETWLQRLPCPVVRLEGEETLEERLHVLLKHLGATTGA